MPIQVCTEAIPFGVPHDQEQPQYPSRRFRPRCPFDQGTPGGIYRLDRVQCSVSDFRLIRFVGVDGWVVAGTG
jgi:hypothetical protein